MGTKRPHKVVLQEKRFDTPQGEVVATYYPNKVVLSLPMGYEEAGMFMLQMRNMNKIEINTFYGGPLLNGLIGKSGSSEFSFEKKDN